MIEKTWWDEVYRSNETLDIGVPSEQLIQVLEREEVRPCKALDVCCGTGTAAVYLARHSFSASAIEVS